ncbi:MAG: hypothetical protein GEU71_03765 [Actinobacteria bacterium]|nr:hypothetical protein [Actinomycetota bacterium]
MRIAVIADIHGNDVALQVVLAHAAGRAVDSYVCLGDVAATGPFPVETIERVAALGCPVVMGNADEILLGDEEQETDDDFIARILEIDMWCAAALSDAHRAHIRRYSPTVSLVDGALLAFHGTPASYDEKIELDAPEEFLASALDRGARVYCGGHWHFQNLRRFADRFYVNPGSVGMSYNQTSGDALLVPLADYAIVTMDEAEFGGADFYRLPYDPAPLFDAARERDMPQLEWWLGLWSTQRSSS